MPHFTIPPVTVHRTIANVTQPEMTPWGVAHVLAPEAWRQTQGEGTVAYVIDTGAWKAHTDLVPNLIGPVRGFAYLQDPAGGSDLQAVWEPLPDNDTGDGVGHGSHVCGTVCAADNGTGVRGVAPRAGLIAAQGIGLTGVGMDYPLTMALHDAADERERWNAGKGGHPVVVVNCSWGGNSRVPAMAEAIARCKAVGIVVVAAAGNEGEGANTVGYPASDPNVLAVAAVDDANQRVWFSSTGPAVLFAAPGWAITSTYLQGGWATMSGTSMAAPHISGMVCLIQSLALRILGKFLAPDDVIAMLRGWARDLGTPGRDPQYGYGLPVWVDAPAPEPEPAPEPPPAPTLPEWVRRTCLLAPEKTAMKVVEDGVERVVTLDSPAILRQARLLVPLRAVVEALGAQVDWDPVNRVATVTAQVRRV